MSMSNTLGSKVLGELTAAELRFLGSLLSGRREFRNFCDKYSFTEIYYMVITIVLIHIYCFICVNIGSKHEYHLTQYSPLNDTSSLRAGYLSQRDLDISRYSKGFGRGQIP